MNRFPQIRGQISHDQIDPDHQEKLMKYLQFTQFNLFNLYKYYNIPKVAK